MPTQIQTLETSNNERIIQKKYAGYHSSLTNRSRDFYSLRLIMLFFVPIRSHLANVKHKRYNPMQQQQQPSQTMIFTEPSTINNNQLWQNDVSSIFSSMNFLIDTNIATEHNKTYDYSIKHPEDDSRSLIGK